MLQVIKLRRHITEAIAVQHHRGLHFDMQHMQVMGVVFESIKQPVINGYLVAGAIVGPGGLQLIKELVQVRLEAQQLQLH